MKIKKKIVLLISLALLLVILSAWLYTPGKRVTAPSAAVGGESGSLRLPAVVTTEARYEVLTVLGEGSYRVRDLATGAETDLAVPSDAKVAGGRIGSGSILRVNESSVLGNSILVFDLSVE